ncbi:MAG: competence/damage-inducible protein A, partial [Thermodesulfobacteriota bacterium]
MSQYRGRGSGPPAAVISVGEELLFGETLDSNGSWLAAEMSHLGLEVVRREVVGDRARFIAAALEVSLSAADVVVVAGGLGPTPDDRTKEAVASFLGVPLRSDSGLLRDLESRYRKLGLKAPPSGSERMALVPSGSRLLHNPVGAAPG